MSNDDCIKKMQLVEEDLCPVIPSNLTDTADGLWMSCILEGDNQTFATVNGQKVYRSCGEGYRYKVGIQMNSKNDVEPGQYACTAEKNSSCIYDQ